MGSFVLFWQRLKYFCQKEFLATLKDPASRVILIVPALIQSLLFGYSATFNLEKVPYAVIDQSRSKHSAEILARLDGSKYFQRISNLSNANQIAPLLDSGQAILVLQFAADFEKQLSAGTATIQALTDGRNTMTASVSLAYLNQIAADFNRDYLNKQSPIQLISRTWYNPNLITRWSFLPGMIATLNLIQVLLLAGLSVAREREQGTFDQLLVTPLTPTQILIGKAIPPLLIGLLQSTFVLLVCLFWFDIPFAGSYLTLYLTLTIFTLSSIGIGLCISAISQSMQQVMIYAFVLIMPMVLLSGLSTPVRNMPDILQTVTYANPLRFAIESVRRIYLEGSGLSEVAWNFLPMLVVALITLPLAGWLFRNKLV